MLRLLRGKILALVILMTVGSSALGMQSLILPLYLRSTGVKPELVGLVLGTSGLALICFEFIWGWWSDRIGVGVPLIISRCGTTAVIFAYAFVQPIPGYFVLQFIGGAFSCAIGPLSWAYLGSVSDPRSRGEAMALAQIPAPVGMGLGALIGGLLADSFGYRYVFIVAAGVAALSATIAALTFHDVRVAPGRRPSVSDAFTGDERLVASAGRGRSCHDPRVVWRVR